MRLDAEYYQPEYLELQKDLEKFGIRLKSFGELLEKGNALTGGATPLGAEYLESGIKFLRVQNIMSGYLDFSDIVYIDKKIHEGALKRSQLIDGNVLLTITGVSYGKSAVYRGKFGEANINQHSVKMHFKSDVLPDYVSMFLNSKYGKFQSDRKITGNTRPALAYEEIREFKIPVLEEYKQKQIQIIVSESDNFENQSIAFYSQAEDLLLEELGLNDFEAKDDLFFIVNLSDVKSARRMDAEYFQPKYEKLVSKVRKQNGKMLGDLVSIKKGIEPGAEEYQKEGKLFIRVSSLSKQGIIDKDQKYLSDELYQKLKKDYEPKVGEILLTKDATPGIACVLKEPVEGIIAGGILRLKVKTDIEAEYLALVVNSIIGQGQAEQDAGGSVIAHWKPEQIKNIFIPILPKPIQQKITDLVWKSHEARKKAKELLEEAKQKIEQLIK